jgi:hypothetical protein
LINMLHPQGAPGFANALLDKVNGDKNAPIALICRTGNRTTQVQRYLQSQGFTQVYNVKEGMAGSGAGPGWIKRGLPVDGCSARSAEPRRKRQESAPTPRRYNRRLASEERCKVGLLRPSP